MEEDIVIVSAVRTPMGGLLGCFKEVSAVELGQAALSEAMARVPFAAEKIDEVIMGCVLSAGQGQAPARQVALGAGLPVTTDCLTINKMCGSGMKAIMLACQALSWGEHAVVAAGGMESMSNAPYLIPKARAGLRLGHGQICDHLVMDGLEDAYQKGQLMGVFAETCAKQYCFSRADQDEFALASLLRTQQAIKEGAFAKEIATVKVKTKQGVVEIREDEQPLKLKKEKIPLLKPAFLKEGTVTAANSSSISDGAACLILTTRSHAAALGWKPLAKVVNFATHSQAPEWFTTAPVGAIRALLHKTKWRLEEVDLFEINEAFAVVAMTAMKELNIPHEKLNIHGGACVLGHPIGASGARIVVTLLYALQKYHLKRGVAALCIGGGEATALAIELEE
ncbi:MAG: acetyl-CoA C-acyltransferase [Gammaproteobacteria bacterium]|nr:acetyl-CoA C-acyltransferase [Gammaproteobacteria bacterium]